MAIVKWSVLVDELLGSVGGVTFQHNHYGPFARLRTIPTDTITDSRIEQRARLSVFSVWWSTVLTDAQRLAWNTLGAATTWQNGLGEDYNPTGQALYVRANAIMDYKSWAYTAVAPDDADEADPGLTLAYVAPDRIKITNYGTLADPPDGRIVIWFSEEQSPGRYQWSGPWTYRGGTILSTLPGPPWSIYTLDAVRPAHHVFFRFRVFRTENIGGNVYKGRATHPFFEDVYCPANP